MSEIRGGTHTTLTETSEEVVRVLTLIPGVTKIAPGVISSERSKGGKRYITASFTNAGMELLIVGQGAQKVAVHCNPDIAPYIYATLSQHKVLKNYTFRTRVRRPGL
ncbi:MAG TPA: DUF2103 domain-containing protein [Candidatus Paceibacterota bacterium]|nr:DUF2103 domain-containing protein [Candidatus Paceibacterota bacterium]